MDTQEQPIIQNNHDTGSNLRNEIEAILFYRAEPVKIATLARILNTDVEKVREELALLSADLRGGIRLVRTYDDVALVTSPESSKIIEQMKKEESTKDLSKAALETLAIVLYRGPIKRSDIDYIRGVNSQFILRLLLIRGLIEKEINPKDERGYLYKTSLDLLNLLGINGIDELPELVKINSEIDRFLEINQTNEPTEM